MKQIRLSWDAILLLGLGTAHLWFNQVSSAILVMLMTIYVVLDIASPELADETPRPAKRHRWIFLTKLTIVLFTIIFATLLPTGLNIMQRRASSPAEFATDGLIQTEVAIEFLMQGKNPYVENYEGTALEAWQGGEPPFTPIPGPLHHFVYLPFMFLSALPAYWLSQNVLGWYDQRLFYLLLFFGAMLLLPLLVRKKRQQLILMMLVGLNFLFTFFLAEGRNDVAMLFGLLLATVLLSRRRLGLSAFVLGLTLMVKHQAWFFLPFYLLYSVPRPLNWPLLRGWLFSLWPLYLAVALTTAPFVVWDARAFFADTVGYIIGLSEFSFPIRGIGLSHTMVALGILPSYDASFPFVLLSLLFGLPVLIYLIRRQVRQNTLDNVWFAFAAFSFAFQFPSRFFNDNYLIFVIQVLFVALFIDPVRWESMNEKSAEASKNSEASVN